MKYLKITEPDEGKKRQGTISIIASLLEVVPEGGFKLDEMRHRFKILDVINAERGLGADMIAFEDADAACVEQCLDAAKFMSLSVEALEFEDAVRDMMSGKTKPEDDSSPKSR